MIFAVIPAYNEVTRIAAVVEGVLKHVDRVIVVDDGSSDGTGDRAAQAGALVVRHVFNSGAGAATMTGIEAARRAGATLLITIDADEQHDPQEIPRLLAPLQADAADIVFANRFPSRRMRGDKPRNAIPAVRRVFNALGNIVTLLATGTWVSDSQCGYKALGPRALRDIHLRMNGFEFCTEIVREASRHRWRIAEIPAKVLYSEYTLAKGQSFANGVRTAFKILLRSFLR